MKTKGTAGTVIAALFVMLLWGSLFTAVKLGYSAFEINTKFVPDILTFAGMRFTVCGVLITTFAVCTKRKMRISAKKELPTVLAVGLFSVILHYAFTYVGLANTDSGKTALLKQLAVALFIPLSFIFVRTEKFRFVNVISAVLCLTGIAALNFGKLGFSFGIPELLILAASVCTVANNVFAKKASATVDPIVMTGYAQLFGGAVLLAVGLICGGGIHAFSWNAALVFGYICAASTVSYCIWYSIIRNGNLSMLFVIKFAEPLFSALTGALFLNENPFTWGFLAAFVLIIIAVTVTTVKPKKKAL